MCEYELLRKHMQIVMELEGKKERERGRRGKLKHLKQKYQLNVEMIGAWNELWQKQKCNGNRMKHRLKPNQHFIASLSASIKMEY